VDIVYVVSEAEGITYDGFRDDGIFEPTTEMLSMGSRTNSLTWEVM